MSFRLERDLLHVLRDYSGTLFSHATEELRVFTEIQIGMRIPDLLIVSGPAPESGRSQRLSYFDCAIVAATIQAGPMSVGELAAHTFAPHHEIERRASRLVRVGLLEQHNALLRCRSQAWRSGRHIIAIEAKLTRWKDAIAQARQYRLFANEAYIAMPSDIVRRNVAALSQCAEDGIGVLAVDRDDVSIVLRSTRNHPISPEWVRIVSGTLPLDVSQNAESNASRQAR